jgi:hypothetical protein
VDLDREVATGLRKLEEREEISANTEEAEATELDQETNAEIVQDENGK